MDGYSSSIQRPQWGKLRIDQMSRWQIRKLMQHRARQRVQTQVGKCGHVQAERDCLSTHTQVKSLALPAEQGQVGTGRNPLSSRCSIHARFGGQGPGFGVETSEVSKESQQTEHATSLDSSSEDERGSGSMPAAGIPFSAWLG